ncbi:MAG: CotH kinase family protein [Lachnospiraceae bacterium]
MKKKAVLFLSILLLIGLVGAAAYMERSRIRLLNRISEEQALQIMDVRTETESLGFSCLLCNGSRMPYDAEGRTFYVPLNMETDNWECLSFTSGEPEYELLLFDDFTQSSKQKLIREGAAIRVLIYTEREYEMYSIVFTGLPMIDIATNEGLGGENFTGSILFYGTDFASAGAKASEVSAHVRGNTSRMYPKKGYKLNLTKTLKNGTRVKDQKSVFGMRKDDEWILYAMYNDETKLRDKLSIDLWQEMGAKKVTERGTYNTALTYVEVVFDNNYYGLYGLMEPVDAKQLNLSPGDYLYKRKNPHGLNPEGFAEASDPYAEVLGFEIKSGDKTENAWEPMKRFCEFLALPDEEFAAQASTWLHEDNAVRMWLFMQIITGHDQRAKNMFYVAKKTEDGYRFSFAPWDMDLTWGNVSVGETNPLFTAYEYETVDDRIYWETAERLIDLNVNGAADQMQKIYRDLRAGILSGDAVEERIMGYDHTIRDSGAASRDAARWPEGAHAENCMELIRYAKDRLRYLDGALMNPETYQ